MHAPAAPDLLPCSRPHYLRSRNVMPLKNEFSPGVRISSEYDQINRRSPSLGNSPTGTIGADSRSTSPSRVSPGFITISLGPASNIETTTGGGGLVGILPSAVNATTLRPAGAVHGRCERFNVNAVAVTDVFFRTQRRTTFPLISLARTVNSRSQLPRGQFFVNDCARDSSRGCSRPLQPQTTKRLAA